jgi:hypothetical protein
MDRCWAMPGKMIVCVRVDDYTPFSKLVTKIDPAGQFSSAINNGFVPGCQPFQN